MKGGHLTSLLSIAEREKGNKTSYPQKREEHQTLYFLIKKEGRKRSRLALRLTLPACPRKEKKQIPSF